MLKEYALDPALLKNWRDFIYFIEKFGVQNGRLISRLPREWEKAVLKETTNCRDVEKKRIVEKLRQLAGYILIDQYRDWNDAVDWLTNAIISHSRTPFNAIIATANPNNHSHVLRGDLVDESDPLFQSHRTIRIRRTAQDMAACISKLLQYSKEIVFVDPYFFRSDSRHLYPLREFLKSVAPSGYSKPLIRRLEYHTSNKMGRDEQYIKDECNRRLPGFIPQGLTLQIMMWGDDDLHNRYVLTDLGGMLFGTGLDEQGGSSHTDEDDVAILSDSSYRVLWSKYKGRPSFHYVNGRMG